ncbi:HNH endonuclease [Phycicoccus sp. CSK15P-2]|uniref:HNH endonuclease n=1 Tax=Phycicoccus sp. CSK15P-2 TaxID=2807627 RepID=UPI0019505927|nr:HNH endonuclease [Phycicoccus sp. CSK15P-2]MBM6404332.1 HNH endonuclease [Phycicoccus sp. CSK15P-2]
MGTQVTPCAEAPSEADPCRPAARVQEFRQWLATVDADALDDHERVGLVSELERVKGAASAAQARTTVVLRRSHEEALPQDAAGSVGSQVALARRESPTLGDRFVGMSDALVHEMPETMAALERGEAGERHAVELVRETATLSREHRAEVDRRVGPHLAGLSWRAARRAARRVAAELDAAGVVRRMEQAVSARRVTVRPAPDGMAYLTVLGPLRHVVGAHAAMQAKAKAVVAGRVADETPDGRGVGAVAADTALRLLSGREPGQVQPVEVQLVMTDRSLLGTGDDGRDVMEPARLPGHGPVPAPVARAWVRDAAPASVWLRRLYTGPDGRDLVAMDSRRRTFGGLLRRMLVLRDDVCATPWCDAPIAHADHAHPARHDGGTSFENGSGTCARCNQVKEAPRWRVHVVRGSPREIEVRTPTGHRYRSAAPPLLGWGTDPPSRLEQRLSDLLAAA